MSDRPPFLIARVAVAAAALALVGGAGASRGASAACEPSKGRHLVLISATSGAIDRSFPDLDGAPAVEAADGNGGWFVGGTFTCVGTTVAPDLVHLDAAGRLDPSWHASLPANRALENGVENPTALALLGDTLYVGGVFGVEAVDAATGARRWLAPTDRRSVDGIAGVNALAASRSAVYAAGGFTTIGGVRREAVAALDPRSGRPLRWQAPQIRSGRGRAAVLAVALAGTRLFVGGSTIATVGGRPRHAIAALDAGNGRLTSWRSATARGVAPGYGVGDVEAILIARGQVLTAGHDGWGVTSASTGRIEPWMYRTSARVFTSVGTVAYLGGNCRNTITRAGGRPRNNLAAIDLATRTFTGWAPDVAPYACVNALAATPDEVLVGGFFGTSLG